jgi:hypothetical protein
MPLNEKMAPSSAFAEFLGPTMLKKLYNIKDPFVQRSFYKALASMAKNIPGFDLLLDSLTF